MISYFKRSWEADREKEINERLDDLKGIVEDVYEDESIAARSLVGDERDLKIAKSSTNGCPWILMGDSNVTLKLEEQSARKSVISSDMQDFIDCVNQIEVEDVYRGDGVASIKRRRHDLSSDGFKDLTTALGRNRLKSDLEDSTASQSRQHGKSESISYRLPDKVVNSCSAFLCPDTLVRLPMDIRLKIDLESDPTSHLPHSLFDVDSRRISIVTMNTFKYHSDVLAISQG
ncbi:hypothetical protein Tco_0327446 [Tanacetum coccineum]